MTALPADEPRMGLDPQNRLDPEQLLRQALIDNAELTLMHVSERLDRLRKNDPDQSKEYEAIFVLIAPHIKNIKNVAEGLLSSEDDEDVHLGLNALAARMEERAADEPRIRELLVSKLGYYMGEIEAHLINTLLNDPDYFLLQKQLEDKWSGFNFTQKLAAIALMGSMNYEASTQFLMELSRKGDRQLRAYAADELVRRSDDERKHTAWEIAQTLLLSPYELGRFVGRIQEMWLEASQVIQKEFDAAGAEVSVPRAIPTRDDVSKAVRQANSDFGVWSSPSWQQMPDSTEADPSRPDDMRKDGISNTVSPPLTSAYTRGETSSPISSEGASPFDPSSELEELLFKNTKSLAQEAIEQAQRTGIGGVPEDTMDAEFESGRAGLFVYLDELWLRIMKFLFGSTVIFTILVPVIYFSKLDVLLLRQDVGQRSLLSLSVITLAYICSIPFSLGIFLYQAAMYVLPGLTRAERRRMLRVGSLIIFPGGLLLSLSFVGSVVLMQHIHVHLDIKLYLIEKLTFFLLPLITSTILVIVGSRFIVNIIRNRPEVYNVVVAGSVWLTGSFASVLVGKRDSDAMQRRIVTRMGLFMYRSDQSHRMGQDFIKIMSLIPNWLIKQFVRLTLLTVIPYVYIGFPMMCLLASILIYVSPSRLIRWAYILGLQAEKLQKNYHEAQTTFQEQGFKI